MENEELEKRADRLKRVVDERFAMWKQDPAIFAETFPDISMTMERRRDPAYCAMDSIATDVMAGSRFEWRILEVFGGDPIFALGQYDPGKPER